MKYLLDRDQSKAFFLNGFVEVASFLSKEEAGAVSRHTAPDFSKKSTLFQTIKGNTLVAIAIELTQRDVLKVGFATLVKSSQFTEPFTLRDSSFASESVLGVLLQLDGEERGSAFFFDPEKEIDLITKATFLLIVFCMPTTRYIKPLKTIFEEPLKKQGYAYGDLLADSLHPLFHRTL